MPDFVVTIHSEDAAILVAVLEEITWRLANAQQPIPLEPCCAWVRDSDERLIATYGLEASRGC